MEKFELDHSYTVLILLGDVPDDPEHWRTAPSVVGTHAAFVNTQTDQIGAQITAIWEDVIEGFVHLNMDIAEKSGLFVVQAQRRRTLFKRYFTLACMLIFLPQLIRFETPDTSTIFIRLIEVRLSQRDLYLLRSLLCRTL